MNSLRHRMVGHFMGLLWVSNFDSDNRMLSILKNGLFSRLYGWQCTPDPEILDQVVSRKFIPQGDV